MKHIKIVLLGKRVLLNKEDVSKVIRTTEVSNGSSQVAVFDDVQVEMVRRQRLIAKEKVNQGSIVLIEGRNAGTAIFPDAAMKIYLTADLSVRAQRRLDQWKEKGITNISLADIANDIKKRDERDMKRPKFPLVANPKQYRYFILDDSKLSEGQTVKLAMKELQKRRLYPV